MPARKSFLTDLAIRQQVILERVKTAEVRSFLRGLSGLNEATTGILNALREDVGQATKKVLNETLAKLTEANTKVMEQATERLSERFGKLADYAVELESKALSVVGPSLRLALPKKGIAYARALAQPISATGELLEPFVANWSRSEIGRLNNAVRKAWGEGQTNQQLIQSIRGTKKNGFKDGILQTTRRNADAVARTAIQHVATSAREALWEENSDVVVGIVWLSTLDGATTQVCRSLDQQEFKMSEGPRPPIHIRCRSTIKAKLDPELGLDFLQEGGTRSSKDGYVDAKLSYYEWLKTQPASFQVEALGKTRAKLFQDGGMTADEFAKLNLGRNFQPLTLEEMRNKAPSIFERAELNP